RVGTGYSSTESRALRDALEKINSTKPAFVNALPAGAEKGVRWAKPELVCEVEFRGWSHDRLILNSSFKGLREDEAAEEGVLGTARTAPTADTRVSPGSSPRRRGPRATGDSPQTTAGLPVARERTTWDPSKGTLAGVRLTHPERILWDEAGITKQGLAEFYAD